jgi:predicted Zn-dependent protease
MKLKAILLFFLCAALLSGCASEYNLATKQEEMMYYSTDQEEQMGRSIAKAIDKQFKPINDPLVQKRVEDIGAKIAAVCDRKEISYHFYAIDDKQDPNAFSLPGGYVYVNKKLMDMVGNDDELACILGHEVGHIVARHAIKRLQASMGYSLFRMLIAAAPVQGAGDLGYGADVAFTEILLGYSREDEFLADQLGTRYAKMAGYDPHGMITFLEKLRNFDRRQPLKAMSYFKTHPYIPDRIRIVKQELGEKTNFNDFINIEDEPHK